MRRTAFPVNDNGVRFAPGELFALCVKSVQKPQEFKERLQKISETINDAEDDYAESAAAATLHAFPRADNVQNLVTKDEMVSFYDYRVVRSSQQGRRFYQRIIASAPNGFCPLCGLHVPSTLDHHLPKAEYPILAVAAANLVPSCTWCQTEKGTAFPMSPEEQTLHPYFDNVENERWLTAMVNQTAPATFTYGVTQPTTWNDLLTARTNHHLTKFRLRTLFARNAGNELTGIRGTLEDLREKGGIHKVRAQLLDRAQSWEAAQLNSWQAAMYRAAAEDEWFCDIGFRLR